MIQTQVTIRTATVTDAEALHGFLAGLSFHAQYQRFFTGLGLVSPSLVRQLVTVSARQQVVLALLGPAVIGHAMATTVADGVVELGVVVGDLHRRQGVATRLVRGLIEQAVRRSVDRLKLDVLCENQLVLGWIRRALPDTRFERDGYSVTGYAPLEGLQDPQTEGVLVLGTPKPGVRPRVALTSRS